MIKIKRIKKCDFEIFKNTPGIYKILDRECNIYLHVIDKEHCSINKYGFIELNISKKIGRYEKLNSTWIHKCKLKRLSKKQEDHFLSNLLKGRVLL